VNATEGNVGSAVRKPATLIIAGLAVVTAVLVLGYRTWRANAAPHLPSQQLTEENGLGRVNRELEQLRNETRVLRQLVNASRTGTTRSPEGSDEDAVDDAGTTVMPTPPAPGPSQAEHLAFVEAEFEREAVDRAWDPSRELRGKLDKVLPQGSSIRELDCRSSMCRLESSHASVQDYEAFAENFGIPRQGGAIWPGSGVFFIARQPEQQGEPLTVVGYLARGSLPSLTQ
jgi:hypothetical protein